MQGVQQPIRIARVALGVVLAGASLGACNADDEGLFSNEGPPPTMRAGSAGQTPSGSTSGAVSAPDDGNETLDGEGDAPAGVEGQGGGNGDGESELPPDEPPVFDGAPIDIEFGQCDDFEPCGGELEGDWEHTSACIGFATLGIALQNRACDGVSLALDAQVEGGLRFAGGRVTRVGSGSGEGLLRVSGLCTLVIASCPGLRDLIQDDEGLCEEAGVECVCDFSTAESEWADDEPFAVNGSTFTLASGRSYEYCVTGDTLTLRATDGTPQDRGTYVLNRR